MKKEELSMGEGGGQRGRLRVREKDLLCSREQGDKRSSPELASNWMRDPEQISSLWALVSTAAQGDSLQPSSWGPRRPSVFLQKCKRSLGRTGRKEEEEMGKVV